MVLGAAHDRGCAGASEIHKPGHTTVQPRRLGLPQPVGEHSARFSQSQVCQGTPQTQNDLINLFLSC